MEVILQVVLKFIKFSLWAESIYFQLKTLSGFLKALIISLNCELFSLDCGVKCGTDNFIPTHLKVDTEVNFTARRLPSGFVENRRYQAKAVWLGLETHPKFIIPPAASKLDEYLEDYLLESGQSLPKSKSSSPEPFRNKLDNSKNSSGNVKLICSRWDK